ncbi:hypothetical protein CspHIS471_0104100 [Cutaneotrichosporon sp. HIS471]|nr:hypothetical protein CspHIS471_0104100 [Cutaneotrichosporon sp. HIS471]
MQWMHIGTTQPPLTVLEPSPSFGSLGFKGPCRDHFVELKRIPALLAYEIRLGSVSAHLVDLVESDLPPLVASSFRTVATSWRDESLIKRYEEIMDDIYTTGCHLMVWRANRAVEQGRAVAASVPLRQVMKDMGQPFRAGDYALVVQHEGVSTALVGKDATPVSVNGNGFESLLPDFVFAQ